MTMDIEDKLKKISTIQKEISANSTRLENAEQSIQLYLERLDVLNAQLTEILNAE